MGFENVKQDSSILRENNLMQLKLTLLLRKKFYILQLLNCIPIHFIIMHEPLVKFVLEKKREKLLYTILTFYTLE